MLPGKLLVHHLVVLAPLGPPPSFLFPPQLLFLQLLQLLSVQPVLLPLLLPPASLQPRETRVSVVLIVQIAGQGCGIPPESARALGGCPPVRQDDTQSLALVGVGGEAVAVAAPRRTLAHVHATGGDVVLGIQPLVAFPEQMGDAQRMAIEAGHPLVAGGQGGDVFALAGTGLGPAHLPGVGKVPDLVVAVGASVLAGEIIPGTAIKVAAQAAQSFLVVGGHRDLQEPGSIPLQLESHFGSQHHHAPAIGQSLYGYVLSSGQSHVRQDHPGAVHLHPQPLAEVHAQIVELQSDRFGPAGVPGAPALVGQPDVECIVSAIGGQQILAAALETEELAVEGTEVRISEYRTCSSRLHAPMTAFSRGQLENLVGPTLDRRTTPLGAPDGAAVAAATTAGSHVPGLVVAISHALQTALAPHLGDGAAGTAAVLLLELGGALQDGASGALAHRGAVQTGAVGASIRHELGLLVVHLFVKKAFAWRRIQRNGGIILEGIEGI